MEFRHLVCLSVTVTGDRQPHFQIEKKTKSTFSENQLASVKSNNKAPRG